MRLPIEIAHYCFDANAICEMLRVGMVVVVELDKNGRIAEVVGGAMKTAQAYDMVAACDDRAAYGVLVAFNDVATFYSRSAVTLFGRDDFGPYINIGR